MLTRDNFHAVTDGEIYRSAQLSPDKLQEVVEEYGIKTVLSLRKMKPGDGWSEKEKAMSTTLGIGYRNIPLGDTLMIRSDELLNLRDLIEDAPKPLLIHCKAGADRTGLAGVMTKLLDGSSSLEEARAQVSFKYYVVRDDSMGIPFFDSYSAWLTDTGLEHSKDQFNWWLENQYADLSGNIHFLVNPIEDQLWERPLGLIDEGREFQIKRSETDILNLSGWAFDTRNVSSLDSISAYLGEVRLEKTSYGIHQPWLIEDFAKEAYLDSGWTASQPLQDFADGCHDLLFKFNRRDGSSWSSPPSARICIH